MTSDYVTTHVVIFHLSDVMQVVMGFVHLLL
jgi:hypothetical protein